jgi:hypothetical protein
MAFALEVLPRSIDENIYAAEILEPADVDAYARIPWSRLSRHAWNQSQDISRAARLNLGFNPFATDNARWRQGVVCTLTRFGRRDGDGIEVDRRIVARHHLLRLGRRCQAREKGQDQV